MKIGTLIKELRLKKGITQEELAYRTEISVRTIQRIEKGEVDPRAYTLKAIASALDVDFELLNNMPVTSEEVRREERIWLPMLHLSGLFITLLPPLLIWFSKKEKVEKIRTHGIEVINFQLNMLLILIPCGLLAVLMIFIPVIIGIGIFSTIIIVLNTIKVINQQPFKYPYMIAFLKPTED